MLSDAETLKALIIIHKDGDRLNKWDYIHPRVQQPSGEATAHLLCTPSVQCRPQSAEDLCAHVWVPGATQDKDSAGQRRLIPSPHMACDLYCYPTLVAYSK